AATERSQQGASDAGGIEKQIRRGNSVADLLLRSTLLAGWLAERFAVVHGADSSAARHSWAKSQRT
ncbi:MAG: hypothetical protein ACPGXX_19675, partial [Planctomycetaceae bacterium]